MCWVAKDTDLDGMFLLCPPLIEEAEPTLAFDRYSARMTQQRAVRVT